MVAHEIGMDFEEDSRGMVESVLFMGCSLVNKVFGKSWDIEIEGDPLANGL